MDHDRTIFEDTSRKRLAFARKQRLERESLPHFSDQIAEEQHGADGEMARRALSWERAERESRAWRAARWREGRARLFPCRMHCARKSERFGPGVLIRPTLRISPISCAASNSESSILTVTRRNEAPENDPSSIVAESSAATLDRASCF